MNLNNNSRRSFLANAAILTAGFAIASPVQLLANTGAKENIKQNWVSFWQMQQGMLWQQNIQLKDDAVTKLAKGQSYTTGEVVYFEEANLMARPLWIYWGEKKTTPDDVILTFFSNKATPEKLFRLNRFELDGLLQLAKQQNQANIVVLLKQDTINRLNKSEKQSQLFVRAKVNTNKRVTVETSLA